MPTQTSTKPSKFTVEKLIFRGAHDLTHQEFRALAILLSYTDEHCDNARPGVPRLMEDLGCKDKKRVQDILKALKTKRYLIESSKGGWKDGRNVASTYSVRVPARIMNKALDAEDGNRLVEDANDSSTGGVGVLSTPTVGVLSTPTVGGVTTPLSDHSSDHVSDQENPYTVTAHAPTHVEDSNEGKVVQLSPWRMLHHKARGLIFDAMFNMSIGWEPEDAEADLLGLLAEHYNEGISDYAADYWTFRNVADEYEAAEQLNKLVHTVVRDLGDDYLIPDNRQESAA